MGIQMKAITFTLIVLFSWAASPVRAATTIDPVNRYAYGANLGWMDWCAATPTNGAVIGEYVCSGYIYSANVGWINLGSGSPANGIQYQNNSATDFGVNQDGLGNLRGYAYGANIGWINFENTGAPKINLITGQMSGYVWSANCGWISLSNAVAYVQTDTISARRARARRPAHCLAADLLRHDQCQCQCRPNRQRHDHRAGLPCGHQSEQRQQRFANHRRELFVRRDQRHAHLEQRADALLLHSENAQPEFTRLDGQRLGTGFALRRFHHDGWFHRHRLRRCDFIASRLFVPLTP